MREEAASSWFSVGGDDDVGGALSGSSFRVSTCFTFVSEGMVLGLGFGFVMGFGSGFFTSFGGKGVGGAMGWFIAGEAGAESSISIIGNGAAAEKGSGAGRSTYQNHTLPCRKGRRQR